MNTAVANSNNITVTEDQIALVKKTVAQGATTEELRLFLYDCQRQGVHPLDRLIHFTKRGGKYVPITSIDLFRQRAASTGEYLGCTKPVWTGKPGTAGSKVELAAKRAVGVHVAEHWAEAHWDEYVPPQGQRMFWERMPHVMIGKVCEALALRKGFPKELAGIYVSEEMDQAKDPGMDLGRAMTQDFPPGVFLEGRLLSIEPGQGSVPGTARIQTPDGTMTFQVFNPDPEWAKLERSPITYRYEKQGKFRVIAEMALADDMKRLSIEAQTTDPVNSLTEPLTIDLDDEAAKYTRGVIKALKVKTGKKGEFCSVKVENTDGEFWANCFGSPAHFGLAEWEELRGQDIFYIRETDVMDDGKEFHRIVEFFPADVFEQAMMEKSTKEVGA